MAHAYGGDSNTNEAIGKKNRLYILKQLRSTSGQLAFLFLFVADF
jgi:hypothetical protein